ncbi:MAG: PepSY-associated TM helix domain-containing protein [Pseudomonadota bacterium]
MDKARHKRNYDLHAWSGVTLGIFLFIVCFTGSVAVFALQETRVWEDPAKRIEATTEPAPLEPAFREWVATQDARGEIEFLSVRWPQGGTPYYVTMADVHLDGSDEHDFVVQNWHPETLEPITTREASMSSWLVRFHIDLKWPSALGGSQVGRFIVGLAGILLLLAILTGIVAHTKLTKETFTLRLDRSVRLKWQDSHKVIGLWGTPFHVMIGFTGAVLGIVTLLAPVVAVLAFQGDIQALFAAVQGEQIEAAGVPAEMISIDTIGAMVHPEAGNLPARINIQHYGDANAVYQVYWPATEKLTTYHGMKMSGVTGEMLAMTSLESGSSGAARVSAAVGPLHFGTFGGVALKYLWFFLGLSLSVITALGTMMWIERRQHGNEGQRSDRFYNGLSRLNVGICTGLAVATAGLFVHNLIFWGDEAGRGIAIAWAYFGVWAAAIAYAFLRPGAYMANRELIAMTGALLMVAAVLNQLMTELPNGGIGSHTATLVIDLTLIVFGVIALVIAKALPAERPVKTKRKARAPRREADVAATVPAE